MLRLRAAGGFVGDSEAERKLARFCADVAAGDPPDPAYLQLVGEALQHFLESDEKTAVRGERVGKALGVARKQGQQVSAKKDWRAQAYAVVDYLEYLETMPEGDAVAAASAKHGIGKRAMRNRIGKHHADAVTLREIDAQWKRFAAAMGERIGTEKET